LWGPVAARINAINGYVHRRTDGWNSLRYRQGIVVRQRPAFAAHVRIQMAHVRQKLENDPAQPKHLVTEPPSAIGLFRSDTFGTSCGLNNPLARR
jgi:hypothetical protein